MITNRNNFSCVIVCQSCQFLSKRNIYQRRVFYDRKIFLPGKRDVNVAIYDVLYLNETVSSIFFIICLYFVNEN